MRRGAGDHRAADATATVHRLPGPDAAPALVVAVDGHHADPALVGGKGAWLDRLVGAGFRVPPTVVVTTEAYRRVASQPAVAELVHELAHAAPPDPEHHEAARRRVDEAFAEVPLPEEVTRALAEADAAVRGTGGLVAARSSATAEDLHGTSFAGQYRSFLELSDLSALEEAVRLVWASLWHPAPRTYRRYHGLDEARLAMAVVVMHQVPATAAGVAFTVDPGGQPGAVRVESVAGLGEQLVSGSVTPAVHLVPRPDADGGAPTAPIRLAVDERGDADGGPALATEEAVAVAELALAVEGVFDEPQDLEWALDDDGLWLLQARPITTGRVVEDDGFDTPDRAGRQWTTVGIVEMVPGVLPPLRWEVCHLLLEEALRAHDGQLFALPVHHLVDRDLLGRVRGRAALDAELRDLVQGRLAEAPERRRTRLRRTWVALRARQRALWEAGTTSVAAYEVADLAESGPALADLTDAELLVRRRRLVDLAGRAMAAEVAVAAAAVGATQRLATTLERSLAPDEAVRWARRVTSRAGGTVAGWPRHDLVAVLAAADPAALATLVAAGSWVEAADALAGDEAGRSLLDGVATVLRRAGSVAVVAGPTWEEEPERVWTPLQELARAVHLHHLPAPVDPTAPTPLDDLLDGLAANPEWRRARIRRFQLVDARRVVLRRQAEDAADLLERRERAKSAVLSLGGAIRRTHLAIGERLAARGAIAEPADVELLGERELVPALVGGDGEHGPVPVPSLAEQDRRRHWLASAEAAGPLPERFEGLPTSEPTPAASGDHLDGWGAASGVVTGRARVLATSGTGGLERGEVLVARTTDASWAPLFMVAGGVVVEEGGPLSHAAIVARELGIPAVVNVPGVVARLEGAQATVTVDGDRGAVTVLDEVDDPGGEAADRPRAGTSRRPLPPDEPAGDGEEVPS